MDIDGGVDGVGGAGDHKDEVVGDGTAGRGDGGGDSDHGCVESVMVLILVVVLLLLVVVMTVVFV